MADTDDTGLKQIPADSADPSEGDLRKAEDDALSKSGSAGEETELHTVTLTMHLSGEADGTEIPSADKGRQSVLTDREETPDNGQDETDIELDSVAATTLKRTTSGDSETKSEVTVEMDILHRSSTRRASFMRAVQEVDDHDEKQGGPDSYGNADDDHAVGASIQALDLSTNGTDGRSTVQRYQEMDILVDEESNSLMAVRGCCVGNRKWLWCVVLLMIIAVMGTVILVPQSLVYVEYYQIALARSRLTGRVDRDKTIYPGCYVFYPDTDLVVFPATGHNVQTKLEVSSSDGLAIELQLSLQYFIKGEELGALHRKYDEHYEEVVRRIIESEVKNTAVQFSLDQYRLQRDIVEEAIYRRLASRLQGNCCPSCCPRHCTAYSLSPGLNCTTCSRSPDCDRGLYMSLLPQHVQFGAIEIPSEVSERQLRLTLLREEAEKETLVQESRVEKKVSQLQTKNILNHAREVKEAAKAEARLVDARAQSTAEVIRLNAYSRAMGRLFIDLNITTIEHRLSVMYMMTFRDSSDRLYLQQYDQLSMYGH